MPKFFVPSFWGKNSAPVEFKSALKPTTKSSASNTSSSSQHKKYKKNKSNTNRESTAANGSENSVHRVKEGRIKKSPKKHSKVKTKLLLPTYQDAATNTTEDITTKPNNETSSKNQNSKGGVSEFQAKLKERLLGGRFRFINEQLYTMNSEEAEKFFKEDKDAFKAYHAGYKQQVEQWPLNPLDRIIKTIKRLPKSLEVADFGCGEGRLAQSVPNKVHSMDLVSNKPNIIACDMASTPLKEQSIDVAVYCLSLMGINLSDYLLEANRVLRLYGLVLIAEIRSRFDDVRQFVKGLEACGFELVKKDCSHKLFYFFQFKKVRNVGKVANLPAFSLKPCLYRKR